MMFKQVLFDDFESMLLQNLEEQYKYSNQDYNDEKKFKIKNEAF